MTPAAASRSVRHWCPCALIQNLLKRRLACVPRPSRRPKSFLRSKRPDGSKLPSSGRETSRSQPSFAIITTYGVESWRPVSK
jgi:hypothetical protein